MKSAGIFFIVAFGSMAAICASCERLDDGIIQEKTVPDSLWTCVHLKGDDAIGHADIFVYSDVGTKKMEGFSHLVSADDSAFFFLPEGDKIVVCIANSRREFNTEALSSFDTMELLRLYYSDENPDVPVLRGTETCCAGDTLGLRLSSPLCSVSLTGIEHSFPDYKRLEDPVMYLENANAFIEALRSDTFIPSETISDTSGLRGLMWDRLPFDIGMYPQHPGTRLRFYPNESSMTPSVLVVEGRMTGGELYRYATNLPLTSCGDILEAELVIEDKPSEFKFTVSRVRQK